MRNWPFFKIIRHFFESPPFLSTKEIGHKEPNTIQSFYFLFYLGLSGSFFSVQTKYNEDFVHYFIENFQELNIGKVLFLLQPTVLASWRVKDPFSLFSLPQVLRRIEVLISLQAILWL